jgi:glycosyltransferase involved in cell wall biosynthesis
MASAKLPSVGVIITSHNCEAYIAEAIACVSRQTVRNLEVVIVDDASVDGTADVIRGVLAGMNDSRFHFVGLDANRGQAGAVRRGLADIGASFVCILDGDDIWYENFIERHLAVHLNTDFPVGFTYCDSHFVNGSSELLTGTAWWFNRSPDDPPHRPIGPESLPTIDPAEGAAHFPSDPGLTLHENWSPTWSCNSMASMMFRRDLIELVFPATDDQARLYLDYYLSTFCMLVAGGIAIHEPLYAYRMHGRNSHSSGLVVGGTFTTSGKDWKAISRHVLGLILMEMHARRASLSAAVGEEHLNRSLKQFELGIPEVSRYLLQVPEPQWHRLPGLNGLMGVRRRLQAKG